MSNGERPRAASKARPSAGSSYRRPRELIEGALGIARQHVQDALNSSDDAKNESVSKRVNSRLNAQTYNGASLVGLRGVIVKCHGNTNHIGIRSALALAKHEIIAQVPQRLETHFEQSQKLN